MAVIKRTLFQFCVLLSLIRTIEGEFNLPCSMRDSYEYCISNESLDWYTARERCIAIDADLTSILDLQEHEFIVELLMNGGTDYWIGLSANITCSTVVTNPDIRFCDSEPIDTDSCHINMDIESVGYQCCECRKRFKWVDQEQSDFMKWQSSEPTGGARCCRIKSADNWKWADYSCAGDDLFPFICKRRTGRIPSHDPTSSQESTEQTSTNNKQNTTMYIGIGIGVALVIIACVVAVIVIQRRRKTSRASKSKYVDEHTYYNTGSFEQPTQDSNQNEQIKSRHGYDNGGNVDNRTTTSNTHNYDDQNIPVDHLSTEYAEINTPAVKPPPMKPKPKVPSPQPVSYAELEFETDNPTPHQHDNQLDQYNYSSVDSLNGHGNMSYHQTSDEYAIAENVPAGGNASPNATPDNNADVNAASRPATMPIYAQPMKNKAVKPAPTSPRVKHVSSPLHQEVLYAVPDKHK